MPDRPIAFMVMPFGVKSTRTAGKKAPARVDFDDLWEQVHKPVLKELGYEPVRADRDVGALIVVEMIRRLALADLVLADVTLSNANVYYEVGVRHAAKNGYCVLIAADWSRAAFDLDQMRTLRYPLPGHPVDAEEARATLRDGLPAMWEKTSPIWEAVPGYPDLTDAELRATAFAGLDELSTFERAVSTIRTSRDPAERQRLTRRLLVEHGDAPVVRDAVLADVLRLVRDNLTWKELLQYIDQLPESARRQEAVLEIRHLALAKTGKVPESIAELLELIKQTGGTAEQFGLLGGRYKQMMRKSHGRARARYLDDAIAAYEEGMAADLNLYYPSSNLARLYLLRNGEGDRERAAEVATLAAVAMRISEQQIAGDVWLHLTRLGAAFDDGDAERAAAEMRNVERTDLSAWNLATTIEDLELSLSLDVVPPEQKKPFAAIVARLRELSRTRALVVAGRARSEEVATERVREAFDMWDIGTGDTVFTTGEDLLTVEEAARRGAAVVLCLPRQAEEHVAEVADPVRFQEVLTGVEVRVVPEGSLAALLTLARDLDEKPLIMVLGDTGPTDGVPYERTDQDLAVIDA